MFSLLCEVPPDFSSVDLVDLFTLNKEQHLEAFNVSEVKFLQAKIEPFIWLHSADCILES